MTMKCVNIEWGGEKHKICPALGAPEEQARFNLQAADQALAAAQAGLDELLGGADADAVRAARANVWAAAAQRDAAQAQLDLLLAGATDEQIDATEAQVAQARVALEMAELSLEKTFLRASFDGVIAAANVTAGEMASAGLPAVTLVDASRFRTIVSVDEIDVGRLSRGQTAQVTLDAFPDTAIPGTVARIAPAASFEGGVVYYDVTVEMASTEAPVRADMTANVTIDVEELDDVLTIPTWVVRVDRDTSQTYVLRQTGNEDETERVDVALGVRHEGVVQVLDGLAEGDVIVWVQDTSFSFGHP
jgi:RND family efflux transporter MFP subunit